MKLNSSNYQDLRTYNIKTFLESYNVLQQLIDNNFSISRDEILRIIDYDKGLNTRAVDKIVERQNERFKRIFGFETTEYFYSRKNKKYQLVLEGEENLLPFKILYDYLQNLLLIKKVDKDKTNLSKVIMFNDEYNSHNIALLIQIANAIISKKQIEFKHFNHFIAEDSVHIVEPWFIKQYNNRLFLGCYRVEKNNIKDEGYKTFTINQIDSNGFKVLDKTIDVERKENKISAIKNDIFEHCIGVRIHREDNPNVRCIKEDIYVETDYKTGKDWINIPIHKNQQLKDEKVDGKFIFLFPKFYFNDAFKQLILGCGTAVNIVKPQVVIDELKFELKKMIESY